MEAFLAIAIGLLVAAATYLMTDRHMVRILFGVALLGTAVNLTVFVSGDVTRGLAPLIPSGAQSTQGDVANALPQALVLTAIVIGFGLFAFALALVYKTAERFDTADVDALTVAEGPHGSGAGAAGPPAAEAQSEATADRSGATAPGDGDKRERAA